jgi:hypothetical protein
MHQNQLSIVLENNHHMHNILAVHPTKRFNCEKQHQLHELPASTSINDQFENHVQIPTTPIV